MCSFWLSVSNHRSTLFAISVFGIWLAVVLAQLGHHTLWRDEVRALSIALSGDSFWEMLTTLRGEGHPALWYILIRAFHSLTGNVFVLQALALATSLLTVALLLFFSPFPRLLVVCTLLSRCFIYEYPVVARNYGIAALLMLLIAMIYRTHRDRGIGLGLLLFLLANTNLIATIMVASFLLFWMIEILSENGLKWSPKFRNFVLNALIASLGVVICGITVLPTFNDAAARDLSGARPVIDALWAVLNPGSLTPGMLFPDLPNFLKSGLLYGMVFALLPKRGAFFAALAGLMLFSVFSVLGASGSPRHAMVWFGFCLSLYWISWPEIMSALRKIPAKLPVSLLTGAGSLAFLAGLAIQDLHGIWTVKRILVDGVVTSRSADLGDLVKQHTELTNAVIVAEPDYFAEAVPYYLDNRIYLVREGRYGSFVRFGRSGKLASNLGETLQISRKLQEENQQPVIIIMGNRLESLVPNKVYEVGYNWEYSASQAQIDEFLSHTTKIAGFGPVWGDETYDVYVLYGD